MDYFIEYNFKAGREVLPACLYVYATEVASILRNMAHLAIAKRFKFSNVTIHKL